MSCKGIELLREIGIQMLGHEMGKKLVRAHSGPWYPLGSPAKNEGRRPENRVDVFITVSFIFGRGANRIPGPERPGP
jgi:hypothetical protein